MRWWRGGRRTPREPKPVCGCRHHLSFHDPTDRACHYTWISTSIEETPVLDKHGEIVRDLYRQVEYTTRENQTAYVCTCRRYIGPEPIGGYFASEIVG